MRIRGRGMRIRVRGVRVRGRDECQLKALTYDQVSL
jgi:hypothetical protein